MLEQHSACSIQGISIEEAISNDSKTLQEYCDNIVSKNEKEARTAIISIIPFALRIPIHVVVLDFLDKLSV